MFTRFMLPASAWVVAVTLCHAVLPSAEEHDTSPTADFVSANHSEAPNVTENSVDVNHFAVPKVGEDFVSLNHSAVPNFTDDFLSVSDSAGPYITDDFLSVSDSAAPNITDDETIEPVCTPRLLTTLLEEQPPDESEAPPTTSKPIPGWTRGDVADTQQRLLADSAFLLRQQDPCNGSILLDGKIARTSVNDYSDAVFTATLKKGKCWILYATVSANIRRISASQGPDLLLYDDGVDLRIQTIDDTAMAMLCSADSHQNDGNYTATMLKYSGTGIYEFKMKATNSNISIIYDPSAGPPRAAFQRLDEDDERSKPTRNTAEILHHVVPKFASRHIPIAAKQSNKAPTGSFNITINIGTFRMNAPLRDDKVPPDQIHDLEASSTNLASGKPAVILTWRSTGEHGCSGTAAMYEVRMSLNDSEFSSNFATGILVQEPRDIVSGNLKPKPPRSRENIAVTVPPELMQGLPAAGERTVYVRLLIANTGGIRSEGSNQVAVNVSFSPNFTTTTTAPARTTSPVPSVTTSPAPRVTTSPAPPTRTTNTAPNGTTFTRTTTTYPAPTSATTTAPTRTSYPAPTNANTTAPTRTTYPAPTTRSAPGSNGTGLFPILLILIFGAGVLAIGFGVWGYYVSGDTETTTPTPEHTDSTPTNPDN